MGIKTGEKPKFITTAIVAIDMHQGHLDSETATMLVDEDERQGVLKKSKRLIAIARQYKIPAIPAIFQLSPIETTHKYSLFSQRNYQKFAGP
jgi:hypothetical protein